jgi:hypothetical protein
LRALFPEVPITCHGDPVTHCPHDLGLGIADLLISPIEYFVEAMDSSLSKEETTNFSGKEVEVKDECSLQKGYRDLLRDPCQLSAKRGGLRTGYSMST